MPVGSATTPETPTTPAAPISLSRHTSWTAVDKNDIGASGYAKGMGPKSNWMNLDLLTGRKVPKELLDKLTAAEQFRDQQEYGSGKWGGAMEDVRRIQAQILGQGYTLADIGKEGVVAGGLAAFRNFANPQKLAKLGWSQNKQGQWQHSSWGEQPLEIGYTTGGWDKYQKSLDEGEKKRMQEAAAAAQKKAEEEAAAAAKAAVPEVVEPARKAAGVQRLMRNQSMGPRRTWRSYQGSSTLA